MPWAWPASSFQSPQRSTGWPRRSSSSMVARGCAPRCAACRALAQPGADSQRGPASACWMSCQVDHRDVGLQVDLRLAVGAHAAEHRPELLFPERERRDQRVQRHLARLEAIGMLRVEREVRAAVLQHDAGLGRGDARSEHAVEAEDERGRVALRVDRGHVHGVAGQAAVRRHLVPRRALAIDQASPFVRSVLETSRSIGTSAKRGSASQRSRSW